MVDLRAAAWPPHDSRTVAATWSGRIAIDETAQLKTGDAACVARQHAGRTGKVLNCVDTVFSAYVTAAGHAWAEFDVHMPKRGRMTRPDGAPSESPVTWSWSPRIRLGRAYGAPLIPESLSTLWF